MLISDRAVALAERGAVDAALDLVLAGLRRRDLGAEDLEDALDAARRLALGFRIDEQALAVTLAGLIQDAETRETHAGHSALSLFWALGPVRELGPFQKVADAAFLAADVTGPNEWADLALGYLAAVMDPRLPRLLARDLRYRPFALNEIPRAEVGGGMRPIEFGAEIFEAVRGELRSGVTDPNIQQPLLEMLTMWGREAAEAALDVVPLVGADPLRAAQALLAIAGPVPAAIAALRRAAREDTMTARLEAGPGCGS